MCRACIWVEWKRAGARPRLRPGMVVRQAPALFHDCVADQAGSGQAFAMYSRAQSPSTFADGYAVIVTS